MQFTPFFFRKRCPLLLHHIYCKISEHTKMRHDLSEFSLAGLMSLFAIYTFFWKRMAPASAPHILQNIKTYKTFNKMSHNHNRNNILHLCSTMRCYHISKWLHLNLHPFICSDHALSTSESNLIRTFGPIYTCGDV